MSYQGRILTRSPYYIKASGTAIETAKLDIYIWAGDLTTDKPANPQHIINKLPLQVGDNDIYFEISELIRDYFVKNVSAYEVTSTTFADCVWVATDLTITDSTGLLPLVSDHYLGLDGYGYFSEGANPQPNDIEETKIVLSGSTYVYFPSFIEDIYDNYDVYVDGVFSSNVTYTETSDSQSRLDYSRVASSDDVTKVVLKLSTTEVKTINFIYLEDCENGAEELKYYDKNGALSITYLFGRSKENLNTSKESYTKDLFGTSLDFSYDVQQHQKSTYNIKANETVTVNSGWIPESQNEVYKQILLSEYIWLDDKPVYLTSNSLEYKTQKYDKLINYTLEFEYSNNEINNI